MQLTVHRKGNSKSPGCRWTLSSKLRNVTPSIDLLLRDQRKQDELWNLFFVASWSEFEAALDDIRIVALRSNPQIATELKLTEFLNLPDEKLLRRLRESMGLKSDYTRFQTDLLSYTLLGFSSLPESAVAQLEAANQLRNILVHRRGKLDAKALGIAPSLKRFSDGVVLTNQDYASEMNTMFSWANHLLGDLIALDKSTQHIS